MTGGGREGASIDRASMLPATVRTRVVNVGTVSGTLYANPATIFLNYTGDGSGDYRLRPGSPSNGGTQIGATTTDLQPLRNAATLPTRQ